MQQRSYLSGRRWWLPLAMAAVLFPRFSAATSCGGVPATYPVSAGSGSLSVGSGSQVNGTPITGSGASVQMSAVRTTSVPSFPALSPASYPSFSSNTNTSATTVAAGTYSNVTPGSGTTTFSGGTYYIGNLAASAANTTLVFDAGTYYISNANLSAASLTLIVNGLVTIYVGSNFTTGSSASLNSGGTATSLRIFLYGGAGITLGASTTLSGVIYGPGTGGSVNIGSSVAITGLLAVNGNITFSGSDSVTLSSPNQTAIGNISTCGTTAGPDHYQVEPIGSAVNCYPEPIFLVPENSTQGNVNTTNTIYLSTSTGHGDWFLGSGAGTFMAGAANSGNAFYQFASSDVVILLFLRDTYPETLTVRVTDGIATATSGTATAADDPAITFAPSGFRITNGNNSPTIIGTQVAGVTSTQSLALQAIRTDTNTGACTAWFASGATVNIGLGFQCNNPTTCAAGQKLSITNNGTTTSIAANPNAGLAGYTPVPLTFSTGNAEAPFTLQYTDAGQITLAAKYNIPLLNGTPSANNMIGSSQFVVQPYTLQLSNIKLTSSGLANPGASSASGGVFGAAGQAFTATVTAQNFLGSATPNFGQETSPPTVTLAPTLVVPSSGHNPSLTGSFGGFTSGAATGTAFSWPEVGIMTLTPSVASYLGSGAITGTTSGNIGRFIPNAFATTVNTPKFATFCGSGGSGFGYVGQPFTYLVAPVITTTALTVGGATAQNYTGSLMRLTNASLTGRTYTPTPASPALNVSGLPATTSDPVIDDLGAGQGSLTFSAGTGLSFTRGTPVAPFSANIALSINVIDLDGAAATNPVSFGTSSGIEFSNGSSQYYGRLVLGNSRGSELLDLPVPLTTQYYLNSAQGFVTNLIDTCTTAPAITFSSYQLNLHSGETCVRDSGSPGASGQGCAAAATSRYSSPASSGTFNLILAAPGAGNSGAVTVTATAPTWLQYVWNASSSSLSSPTGLATFGVFPGPDSRIYQREVY